MTVMDRPDDRWDADVVRSGTPTEPTPAMLLPAVVAKGEVARIDNGRPPLLLADVVVGVVAAVASALHSALRPSSGTRSTSLDAALGASWQVLSLTGRSASTLSRLAAPMTRVVVDPPFVPHQLRMGTWIERSAAHWRQRQPTAEAAAAVVRDTLVVATVDTALEPVDLTELVIDQVDLCRVVEAALTELDLTQIVLTDVDLERVANAVLDQIDLDQVALQRMDTLAIASYVIDGIDLPGIIRESTGSVASETVRSVRMQSVEADEFVQRTVDRFRLLRKNRDRDEGSS